VKAYPDFDPAVLQVQCMGVALGAIADDADFLLADDLEVGVAVVVDGCH